MLKSEILEGLELELSVLDDNIVKPNTSDSSYWFDSAAHKFITTRAFGNNPRREGFEQTQKRIDDLRTLVVDHTYVYSTSSDTYTAPLPTDYLFTVGEAAGIASLGECWPTKDGEPIVRQTDVLEATVENIDRQRENTFSEYRLHNNKARPLRLYKGNDIKLYTDGNYYIANYELTYIRKPEKINFTEDLLSDYKEFPDAAIREIIKLAAQLYIENQGNARYTTYSNEINSME